MRVVRGKLALVLAVGFSLIAAMSGSAATVGDGDAGSNVSRFAKIDTSLLESNGQHANFAPALLSDQPVSAVLEMTDAPVAVQDANARKHGGSLSESDKQSIRGQIESKQNQLRAALSANGAQVVGQMQDAYNGIQVIVPQKNLPQLASLPGVAAIHAVPSFEVDNVNGVPFIGGPEAWGNFSVTGKNVNVGIIDTGIDYTHADFGGPGTVAAWNAARANSTAAPDPSLVGPGAPKVKGGFDFVGDAYNANIPGSVPQPDPNPLDCFGHGSHTAGTLAGFGVLSDGTTFSGPYNAGTVSSHTWNVGPGVAPEANLFVYRVFGCAGSSNVVDLGINQAIKDGVSVISMSLGSPLGGFDDPTSVAAQNAFNDGITVVASAGNNGTNAYLVGSPSTANGVLSVAAIDGSVPAYPGAMLNLLDLGGGTGSVTAIDANGAALPSGSFPVQVLRNANGTISLGCNKSEYAGSAGKVVVTMRGTCARVARAVFGDEAGAAAVVMINNSAGLPPFEGKITSDPDTGEQHTVTIPFLGVSNSSAVVNALLAADGGQVTLSPISVPNNNYRVAASFTSGGPRTPDSAPKPDVMAPGVSVSSVGMGTGNQPTVMSGTSMACPMTAGIAALLKQAHPGWTGVQIKAAIMNTADATLNLGYNVRVAGTGVVQAQKAVDSTVIATTADNRDSIAFGYVPGTGDYSADKTFTLTNYGTSAATYDLHVAFNGSTRGSSVTVSPSTVSVGAGASATVDAHLFMPAAAFAALPSDDTFPPTGLGPGAVISVRGDVTATRDAGDTSADHQQLSVPFIFIPRGVSNVVAGAPGKFLSVPNSGGAPGQDFAASLNITNSGIHNGTADLYAWGIRAPRGNGLPNDVRDVGLQVDPGPALGGTAADRTLVFLINTWGQSANQSLNEYDVAIDTNGDGVADFVVVGADIGAVLTGQFDGRFGSFVFNAHTNALVDANFAEAPMNGSIVELPLLASDLGLSPQNHGIGPSKKLGITYQVAAFNFVPGGPVDVTGTAMFDPYAPAVSSGDFASLDPGQAATFTLTEHMPQQAANGALGWLVATVDDANGAPQADEVSASK
jgi:minor extracellular serine protease Vpr